MSLQGRGYGYILGVRLYELAATVPGLTERTTCGVSCILLSTRGTSTNHDQQFRFSSTQPK